MENREIYYPEVKFGDFTRIDGTIAFYSRVNALLEPGFQVLDYGCGRAEYQSDPVLFRRNMRIIKGKVNSVIGIDLDPSASANPYIDVFHHLSDSSIWPLEDNSVDLCLCDWVLEHIRDPISFFTEASRVIKKGGFLCIRTTNKWGYVGIFSRLIPERFHKKVLIKVQKDREEKDIFPTYYNCNTLTKFRENFKKHNFDYYVYAHQAEPAYLASSRGVYFLGTIYQSFVPSLFASSIYAFGQKK